MMNDMCLKIKTLLPFQGVGEKQTLYPGRCPGLGAGWAFSPHYFIICTKRPERDENMFMICTKRHERAKAF